MSSPHQYFGGEGWLRGNEIRPLSATDFPTFVKSYIDVPNRIPCTRAHYHSQPEDEQKRIKSSPYFTACSFKEGTTERRDTNAEGYLMGVLDIDDPEIARHFVESPEAVADALWPFNFVLYASISSTPERPKCRVVVPVKEGRLEDRHTFVRGIAGFLGMPQKWSGHRESNVASQPFARPCVFEDDPKDFSPVLISRLNGQDLQLVDIPALEEGEEDLFAYRSESTSDELDHLPIRGLSVEDIREPLFKIDSDCDYLTWTRCLTGIRHQFRDEEEAREAFFLADEWCQRGSKYKDGDTKAKWRSFKPDAPGKTPVTLATLFHIAANHGWKNTRLARKLALSFKEWLATITDPVELMDEGPAQIAAQPFKNSLSDSAMLADLQARLKDLGTKVKDVHLVSAISKARREETRAKDDGNLPGWLRPYTYVGPLDKWYNCLNGVKLAPAAFNRVYGRYLMSTESGGARPTMEPSDFALNLKGDMVKCVDGIVYDPRWQGAEPFFEKDGKTYVNTYLASSVPALDEVNAEWAGKMLKKHLKKLIREPLYQRIILDWMAYIVQNPGRKIRWVPVIQGAQGCGKTFLLNILAAAIGNINVKLSNPGSTKSDFNDWAAGAQVVGIEEIRVKGMNKTEIMDKLKDLTTNDRVALNVKHESVATIDNITNYCAFSNYHDCLALTDDDRRYFVIKSRIQSRAQKQELAETLLDGTPYFNVLARLLEMGGAVRAFLLAHEVSADFNPNGDAPDTVYRRQMIEESKSPLQQSIEDMIRSGQHPMIGRDLILYEDLLTRIGSLKQHWEKPSEYLYNAGYAPHQVSARHQVNGSRSQVWVHGENYDAGMFGDPFTEMKRRYDAISEDSI